MKFDHKPGFGEGFAKHLPEMEGHTGNLELHFKNLIKAHPGAALGLVTILLSAWHWKKLNEGSAMLFVALAILVLMVIHHYWRHKTPPVPVLVGCFVVALTAFSNPVLRGGNFLSGLLLVAIVVVMFGSSIIRRRLIISAYESGAVDDGQKMRHFQTPGESLRMWLICGAVAGAVIIGLRFCDAGASEKLEGSVKPPAHMER